MSLKYIPVSNVPEDDETPFPTYGTTAERPPRPAINQQFMDFDLDAPVWWTGTKWAA